MDMLAKQRAEDGFSEEQEISLLHGKRNWRLMRIAGAYESSPVCQHQKPKSPANSFLEIYILNNSIENSTWINFIVLYFIHLNK